MTATGPLAGVRVVDLSTMIAGPWVGAILADQGADVIKVEEPKGGDLMRYAGTRKGDVSTTFFMANRGKRSVALNLKQSEGIETLMRLAATSDVVLHNFRPGVAERLGIGYEDVRVVRDDIIYASISGYGESGPRASKGAYDPILQAFTGMAWFQGKLTGKPTLVRANMCDKITALMAAQAISAALYARSAGRGGQKVHVSMLAATTAFSWVDLSTDEAFLDPEVDVRPPPVEESRLYRFADGWAAVSPAADRVFIDMLRAFDVEGLDDPRLQTFASRMANPEINAAAMASWEKKIATVPLAEGIARLEALDVPCAPVQTLAELAGDDHVAKTGVFTETDYPGLGCVREPLPPAQFSGTPAQIGGAAPSLGEHSEAILAELAGLPARTTGDR